jgi:uncharacterized protein YbaA (DUF1428 family)
MSYIDGFVIPVRTADKQAFIDHAERMDRIMLEHGALRVVEWPDKDTRNAAFKAMESNAALMAEPMPFDGKRMIFGGFAPVVELEK